MMDKNFTEKMKGIQKEIVDNVISFFKDDAIEAHLFGSIARGSNDALSDVDIWITFSDDKIDEVVKNRMASYNIFGKIVLLHEMQNNFPLNGIQTAIIYKIKEELIRVDFYLCPLSSSRILPGSKIIFEKEKIDTGSMIMDTKRVPRDFSDRVTFLMSMCFNGIKKVVRGEDGFLDFLITEFQKYEKEIQTFHAESIKSEEFNFNTIRNLLAILEEVSDKNQKNAIAEIKNFTTKIEKAYN